MALVLSARAATNHINNTLCRLLLLQADYMLGGYRK